MVLTRHEFNVDLDDLMVCSESMAYKSVLHNSASL